MYDIIEKTNETVCGKKRKSGGLAGGGCHSGTRCDATGKGAHRDEEGEKGGVTSSNMSIEKGI